MVVRTIVERKPLWLCSERDCGGFYNTVQERCACGGTLVARDDLMPVTAEAIGTRIRDMLFSLVSDGHSREEDLRGVHSHATDELRRTALDHAGFCWVAPGEMAPSCGCSWTHDQPQGPRVRLAEDRTQDKRAAAQWERITSVPCLCGAKPGEPCVDVGEFSWHVMRKAQYDGKL